MANEGWKTVRLRAPLHEKVEARAKAAGHSTAQQLEWLVEASLVRQEGKLPNARAALYDALKDAEAKGAGAAAEILREVLEREMAVA